MLKTRESLGLFLAAFVLALLIGDAQGQTNQPSPRFSLGASLRPPAPASAIKPKLVANVSTNKPYLDVQLHSSAKEAGDESAQAGSADRKAWYRSLSGSIQPPTTKGLVQLLNPFAPLLGGNASDLPRGIWSGLPGGRPPARSIQNTSVSDIPGMVLFSR